MKDKYIIGASINKGAFYAKAKKIKEKLEPQYIIEVLSPSTSSNNLQLLTAGTIHAAFIQGDVYWKFISKQNKNSTSEIKKKLEIYPISLTEDLNLVTEYNSKYNSVFDLKNKRISINHEGSGVHDIAIEYLKSLGIFFENKRLFKFNTKSSIDKLLKGQLDAFFLMQAHPSEVLAKLIKNRKIKFIKLRSIGDKAFARHYSPTVIDISRYKVNEYAYSKKIKTWGTEILFIMLSKLPEKIKKDLKVQLDSWRE